MLIAKAGDIAPRGPHYAPTDASRAAQRMHLDRLHDVRRYPGCTFTNSDKLATYILSSVILDLLVLSSVPEKQLNAAVKGGNGIYDQIKLKELLQTIESIMVALNAQKKNSIQIFRDYLAKKLYADKWPTIQESYVSISNSLNKLRSDMAENQPRVVGSVGFENAGDLQAAALQYQEKIYQYLSKSPEPVGDPARAELETTIDKLATLFEEVVVLERGIANYLQKFASASPQTPPENLAN